MSENKQDDLREAVLNPEALAALTNNQRQLDMDGCEVGVSRQALEELLAAYHALIQRQRAVPAGWQLVPIEPTEDAGRAALAENKERG